MPTLTRRSMTTALFAFPLAALASQTVVAGTDMSAQAKNQALDEIILARRSIREFTSDAPPKDAVTAVINAGMHAPYTLAAVERFAEGSFRRFYVFPKGSEAIAAASGRMNAKVKQLKTAIEAKAAKDTGYRQESASWLGRLSGFERLGHVPGVTNAPYFIVIAEKRGIPDLGLHALAHCLENMWLKATALDLAFQIISITGKMGDDPEFCALLGLAPGQWDLMGCALGYAAKPLGPSQRPDAAANTSWLK
jgi:nitroreductase